MATSATSAHPTRIARGNAASPELFTVVAEVTSIGGPSLTRAMVDVSNMDSSSAMEFVSAGLYDGGEVTLGLNCLVANATFTQMSTDLTATSSSNWEIYFHNWTASTVAFTTDFATDNRLDIAGHGLHTGHPVQVTSSGTPVDLPAGLVVNTTYWVHYVSANELTLHTTNAGAVADTGEVTLTDDGTGTHTLHKGLRWQVDGHFSALSPTANVGDKLSADGTFKVTGAATFT